MDARGLTVEDVERVINEIKQYMPETYKSIQAQAAPERLGNTAFSLVRRGIRGEANCFYAFERGRVVGAPFAVPSVMEILGKSMAEFGVPFFVVWPQMAKVPA